VLKAGARSAIGKRRLAWAGLCSPVRQFSESGGSTAVLRPTEAEVIGIEAPVRAGTRPWGKRKRRRVAALCAASIAGTGYPSPSSRATFVEGSRAASSWLRPRAGVRPRTPFGRGSVSVWPPLTKQERR